MDPEEASSGGGGRSGLLDQIRHGTTLKPVDNRDSDPPPSSSSGGIVGALAQALAQRKNALQGSGKFDIAPDKRSSQIVFICPFEKLDVLCYGVWRPSVRKLFRFRLTPPTVYIQSS